MSGIEYGYCHCGCGQKTKIAKQTDNRCGHIRGEPIKYIHGHQSRGHHNGNWKGGVVEYGYGYTGIHAPAHNRSNHSGYVAEHIIIAEHILGCLLPEGAVVHHVDGNRKNNNMSNLVICQDSAYHTHLHLRMRAYEACGHANWRKCRYCKKWDDTVNMTYSTNGHYHKACAANHRRQEKEKKCYV